MYYEDIELDKVYKSKIGRTVTEFDNILFTLLTNNMNQIHFNIDFTRRKLSSEPFKGRLIVNGLLTVAIGVGLTTEFSIEGGIMLGIEDIKFIRPVFPGDTLYTESIVIEKRISRSKPGYGVVKVKTDVLNQNNDKVATFTRVLLVPRRPESTEIS